MTKVYLAGALSDLDAARECGGGRVLVSYVELRDKPKLLDALVDLDVFLDCGAWSVFTGAVPPIDVRDYVAWLRDVRFPFRTVAALDVIGNALSSEVNWRVMVDAGITCAPTWHVGESVDLARRYADSAPAVAIGGLAGLKNHGPEKLGRWIGVGWGQLSVRPVHLFGVGVGKLLAVYKPKSVDCTTWLVGDRFEKVLTMTRWPSLAQVIVRARPGGRFRARRVFPLLSEMRQFGSTWEELSASASARRRYNVRMLVEYVRRMSTHGAPRE